MEIFAILFPVFSLVLIGYGYGKKFKPDMDVANGLVLRVFVPALVFDVMASKHFAIVTYQWLLVGGLMVVLGSGVLAWLVARLLRLPVRAFVPTMMFNNCGNLGLPLAVLTFGEHMIQAAVVLFLISNLLHFTLGVSLFGGAVSWRGLLATPVNVATALGLLVNFANIKLPELLLLPISMLGQIVIPLMLFSLGVRMLTVKTEHWKLGFIAAVVCPLSGLIPAWIAGQVLPLGDLQFEVLLLFAALPPAVLNFLFSEQYRQRPDSVASMVLIGNAGSVFILSFVLWQLVY